jgi:hypothetical protein
LSQTGGKQKARSALRLSKLFHLYSSYVVVALLADLYRSKLWILPAAARYVPIICVRFLRAPRGENAHHQKGS